MFQGLSGPTFVYQWVFKRLPWPFFGRKTAAKGQGINLTLSPPLSLPLSLTSPPSLLSVVTRRGGQATESSQVCSADFLGRRRRCCIEAGRSGCDSGLASPSLVAIKPRNVVFCCLKTVGRFGYLSAELGPATRSSGSGTKNAADRA